MEKETEEIIVSHGAIEQLGALIKQFSPQCKSASIIADSFTAKFAMEKVIDSLEANSIEVNAPLIFNSPPIVQPNEYSIDEARQYLRKKPLSFVLCIGSGTLNDIVKVAAFDLNRRYICVATAASVDGYTSFGASVTYNGFKHTEQCMAPIAIIADIDILTNAPYSLTSAGWGDLVAKIPSGADWLLANVVEKEPIDDKIWNLVEEDLVGKALHVHLIKERDQKAIGEQFAHLARTGIAMQLSRSSRPASGAEHLISHIWEMDHLCYDGVPLLHGHKVFLGTLISTALYEYLFSLPSIQRSQPFVSKTSYSEHIVTLVGKTPYLDSLHTIGMRKYYEEKDLEKRERFLISLLPQIKERVSPQLLPFSTLKQLGEQGGLATHPHQLGITKEQTVRAIVLAQILRERYTILDYLAELGILRSAIDSILNDPLYFG